MAHRGVALDDVRNTGVLAFLVPADYSDEAIVRNRLSRTLRHASPAKIDTTVARVMAAKGPPKPVSQALETVADPHYGLGTHPDLIDRLWHLDDALPEKCRWVVYGKPALVHPHTGVIFGFAGGTLGYALRLPEAARREADRLGAKTAISYNGPPPDIWDAGKAGPEWRFGLWCDREPDWCRAAFKDAGLPA